MQIFHPRHRPGDGVFLWKLFISVFSSLLVCTASYSATAASRLEPTKLDGIVSGLATLEDTTQGLKINVTVTNATPGPHAIHIHEFGACGDEGKAAGAHYNPESVPHGLLVKDGPAKAHTGDMGNIEVGPDGIGRLEILLPDVSLHGEKIAVGGKSLVLHEKEDDLVGQPSGNAGGRIACGAITTTQ